jgi:hypothetical protein
VTAHAFFVAYRRDGTPVPGTPFFAIDFDGDGRTEPQWMGPYYNSPAVGDIDGDGRTEIVFAGRDHVEVTKGDGRGRVFCIEVREDEGHYNPDGMEWPTVSADARNSGRYPRGVDAVPPGNPSGIVVSGGPAWATLPEVSGAALGKDGRPDADDLAALASQARGDH